MPNLNDPRKGVGHRLAIIEGHLRKVKAMVEAGDDCLDVIHQSRAIQQALRKFDEQMLAQHLRVCVARDIQQGKGATITNELLGIFDRI